MIPIITITLVLFAPSYAATLQKHTAEAFSAYIIAAEKELESRAAGQLSFLRAGDTQSTLAGIKKGNTIIRSLNKKDKTPDGIIHDWIGTIYIPGSNQEEVIRILTDYDSHKSVFEEVIESELIEQSGNHLKSYLRFKKKEILTVVTDTWYEAVHRFYPGRKAQLLSRSIRINEVENYGKANERRKPEGKDNGFLWRMNTYWSLEESGDGVFVECRSISLSRDIPFGLDLIIRPIVNKMPRKSLEKTLKTLRQLTIDD